ncbi:MAG: flagellar filament capping protein FliD [Defluviitaleaceae bacterium]|nr:flagellar filament capping protein FliD [Defluviitaleaceae bacterium]
MPINTNFRLPPSMANVNPGLNPLIPSSPGGSADTGSMINQLVTTSVTFLSLAGSRAQNLQTSFTNLAGAFGSRVAHSSNSSRLEIRSFNAQNLQNTTVLINQVAVSQRNEGNPLNSNTVIEFDEDFDGVFKFEVEVNGNTHQLSFTVEGDLTHNGLQQHMLAAINGAGLGINATITTTESGVTGTLNLQSTTTGAGEDGQPGFAIRDVTGNAVAITGADTIARDGLDAIFSVNGGEQQTSATNDISLPGGLNVRLHTASTEPVTISSGNNVAPVRNNLHQMISDYNRLLDLARSNSGDRATRMLARDIENAARANRRDLESIGISFDRDGFLVVNDSRLNQAIENGNAERLLTGNGRLSRSFIGRLDRISNSVLRNPMRHVSPHVSRLPGFNAAMNAVNSNNRNNARQATPFSAYEQNDLMLNFFN